LYITEVMIPIQNALHSGHNRGMDKNGIFETKVRIGLNIVEKLHMYDVLILIQKNNIKLLNISLQIQH